MKNLKYFFAAFLFLGFMGMGTNVSAQNTDVKKPRKVSKAEVDHPANKAKTKHVGDDGHSNEADKPRTKVVNKPKTKVVDKSKGQVKGETHPGNDGHAKAADKKEGNWTAKEARAAKRKAKAKVKKEKQKVKEAKRMKKAKAKTRR